MIFKSFHVSVHDFQQYDMIVKVGPSIGFIFYRMMYNGSSDIKFIWVFKRIHLFGFPKSHIRYERIYLVLKLLRFGNISFAKVRSYP